MTIKNTKMRMSRSRVYVSVPVCACVCVLVVRACASNVQFLLPEPGYAIVNNGFRSTKLCESIPS